MTETTVSAAAPGLPDALPAIPSTTDLETAANRLKHETIILGDLAQGMLERTTADGPEPEVWRLDPDKVDALLFLIFEVARLAKTVDEGMLSIVNAVGQAETVTALFEHAAVVTMNPTARTITLRLEQKSMVGWLASLLPRDAVALEIEKAAAT